MRSPPNPPRQAAAGVAEAAGVGAAGEGAAGGVAVGGATGAIGAGVGEAPA
jgi:hypothetical protein